MLVTILFLIISRTERGNVGYAIMRIPKRAVLTAKMPHLNDRHGRGFREVEVVEEYEQVKKFMERYAVKCPRCGREWVYKGSRLSIRCNNCNGRFRR